MEVKLGPTLKTHDNDKDRGSFTHTNDNDLSVYPDVNLMSQRELCNVIRTRDYVARKERVGGEAGDYLYFFQPRIGVKSKTKETKGRTIHVYLFLQ